MNFDPFIPLLVLSLAPGIFWLWYFYHRDRYEPEPLSWIVVVYFLGIAVTIPVAIIEGIAGLFISGVIIAVIVAPVVEEYGKYFVVRHTVYTTPVFNEPMDGIVYAAAAALGFATLENVIYVFSSETIPDALGTGIVRAVLSVPGHALFSIMWGYALGRARFLPPGQRPGVIGAGLILAMVFHGIFNFLLIFDLGFALLVLVLTPVMWWLVNRDINRALGWGR
jgi:RsiW-degrading membrane proteinase PrsW (M82 family)